LHAVHAQRLSTFARCFTAEMREAIEKGSTTAELLGLLETLKRFNLT
jgi:hypothetical protein